MCLQRAAAFVVGFLMFLGLNFPCHADDTRCNSTLSIGGKRVEVHVDLTEYPAAVKTADTKSSLERMGLNESYVLRSEPGYGESSVRENCAGYVIRRVWGNSNWRYKADAEALMLAVEAIAGPPVSVMQEGDIVFYGSGNMRGYDVKHVAYVTSTPITPSDPHGQWVPANIEGKDNDGPYLAYSDGMDTRNYNLMAPGGGKWGDKRVVYRRPAGGWGTATVGSLTCPPCRSIVPESAVCPNPPPLQCESDKKDPSDVDKNDIAARAAAPPKDAEWFFRRWATIGSFSDGRPAAGTSGASTIARTFDGTMSCTQPDGTVTSVPYSCHQTITVKPPTPAAITGRVAGSRSFQCLRDKDLNVDQDKVGLTVTDACGKPMAAAIKWRDNPPAAQGCGRNPFTFTRTFYVEDSAGNPIDLRTPQKVEINDTEGPKTSTVAIAPVGKNTEAQANSIPWAAAPVFTDNCTDAARITAPVRDVKRGDDMGFIRQGTGLPGDPLIIDRGYLVRDACGNEGRVTVQKFRVQLDRVDVSIKGCKGSGGTGRQVTCTATVDGPPEAQTILARLGPPGPRGKWFYKWSMGGRQQAEQTEKFTILLPLKGLKVQADLIIPLNKTSASVAVDLDFAGPPPPPPPPQIELRQIASATVTIEDAQPMFNLAGRWESKGRPVDPWRPAFIAQNGADLTFTNEWNQVSRGGFESAARIKATDWRDLRASVVNNGNQINWDNGSVWRRAGTTPPDPPQPPDKKKIPTTRTKYGPFAVPWGSWFSTGVAIRKGESFSVKATGAYRSVSQTTDVKTCGPDGCGPWRFFVLKAKIGAQARDVGSSGGFTADQDGVIELGSPRGGQFVREDAGNCTGSLSVEIWVDHKRR